MMKFLLLFPLLLLFFQNGYSQDKDFSDASFQGADGGTFIRVMLQSNDFNVRVLITNLGLFTFLKREKHINKIQYQDFIRNSDIAEKIILINDNDRDCD